eukprot:4652354-Amphidinium_carterae.6
MPPYHQPQPQLRTCDDFGESPSAACSFTMQHTAAVQKQRPQTQQFSAISTAPAQPGPALCRACLILACLVRAFSCPCSILYCACLLGVLIGRLLTGALLHGLLAIPVFACPLVLAVPWREFGCSGSHFVLRFFRLLVTHLVHLLALTSCACSRPPTLGGLRSSPSHDLKLSGGQ